MNIRQIYEKKGNKEEDMALKKEKKNQVENQEVTMK